MRPILCLDFDGVVHSYTSGWKGARNIPDPPVPGAIEFIMKALDADYDVVIHSSRARYFGGIWAMRRWLRSHSKVYVWDQLKDEHREHAYWDDMWDRDQWGMTSLCDVRFTRWKPAALVTIDDRGYRFDGTWPDPRKVMALKPWNKA